MPSSKEQYLITHLLAWYENHARDLPWRYDHHEAGDPYHTWLSEIMLQQTTVTTVKDYFRRFIHRWPTLDDLAMADEHDVLTAWQGLGYYSRARNLLKCAQTVLEEHAGVFPQDPKDLLRLPGVGPYTANAIASIAFKQPTLPVDGNVIRVFSRFYALGTPLPDLKGDVETLAKTFPPTPKPGNFAQALMDLGATLCTPKNPKCESCPLQKECKGFAQSSAADLPRRKEKLEKPTRYGKALLIYDHQGHLLLRKRPSTGLLANMMEVPTTLWSNDCDAVDQAFERLISDTKVTPIDGLVKHTFTHFHLELEIFYGGAKDFQIQCPTITFVAPKDLKNYPLPTVFKKVISHGNKAA